MHCIEQCVFTGENQQISDKVFEITNIFSGWGKAIYYGVMPKNQGKLKMTEQCY